MVKDVPAECPPPQEAKPAPQRLKRSRSQEVFQEMLAISLQDSEMLAPLALAGPEASSSATDGGVTLVSLQEPQVPEVGKGGAAGGGKLLECLAQAAEPSELSAEQKEAFYNVKEMVVLVKTADKRLRVRLQCSDAQCKQSLSLFLQMEGGEVKKGWAPTGALVKELQKTLDKVK